MKTNILISVLILLLSACSLVQKKNIGLSKSDSTKKRILAGANADIILSKDTSVATYVFTGRSRCGGKKYGDCACANADTFLGNNAGFWVGCPAGYSISRINPLWSSHYNWARAHELPSVRCRTRTLRENSKRNNSPYQKYPKCVQQGDFWISGRCRFSCIESVSI